MFGKRFVKDIFFLWGGFISRRHTAADADESAPVCVPKLRHDCLGEWHAKTVNNLIAQNARVAQNQTEYNERYDALVSRYEETERRRDEVADRINQIMVRRRKLERFIETVEALPELYTEFDAGQWAALVDSMTVHAKDRITFTLTSGMEIEA